MFVVRLYFILCIMTVMLCVFRCWFSLFRISFKVWSRSCWKGGVCACHQIQNSVICFNALSLVDLSILALKPWRDLLDYIHVLVNFMTLDNSNLSQLEPSTTRTFLNSNLPQLEPSAPRTFHNSNLPQLELKSFSLPNFQVIFLLTCSQKCKLSIM